MSDPDALFTIDPRFCIDTNVVVSFMHEADDEPYRRDAFVPQWNQIESLIGSGEIISPRGVHDELETWEKQIPAMKRWLETHGMFVEMTSEQLTFAKVIVNDFPDYGSSKNYLADLEVISLAGVRKLAVLTNERVRPNISINHPKIPEVCQHYGIECLSVSGFLARLNKE